MLRVSTDWNYTRLLGVNQTIHREVFGTRHTDLGYIPSINTGAELLPFIFRGYELDQYTYNDESINRPDIIENIENKIENLNENTIGIYHIYTTNVTELMPELINKGFDRLEPEFEELYTKCVCQMMDREYLNNDDIFGTAVKHNSKLAVIIISNYIDSTQASGHFLTVGLLPELFPQIKEQMNTEIELNFYKELVHRSQLKRIVNNVATTLFDTLMASGIYADKIEEILFNASINNVVNSRINKARSDIENSRYEAEDALNRYANAQRKYFAASDVLKAMEQDKDAVIEEFKTALKTEGVVKRYFDNNSILVVLKTPVTFFEPDEAELVEHNIDNALFKYVYHRLFVTGDLKLNVLTEFKFKFGTSGGNTDLTLGVLEEDQQAFNALYNPHIHYFNCVGDYRPKLIDAVEKQDLLMFINIALASSKSFNFRDSAVMNRWFADMSRYCERLIHGDYCYFKDIKCLYDENGEYSFADMYQEYLKSLETNEPNLTGPDTTELPITDTVDETNNEPEAEATEEYYDEDYEEEGDDWLE